MRMRKRKRKETWTGGRGGREEESNEVHRKMRKRSSIVRKRKSTV